MKIISILLIILILAMPVMAIDLDYDISESDKQAHFLGGAALAEFVQDSGGGWFNALAVVSISAYLWENAQGADGSDADWSATVSGAIVNIAIIRPLSDWIASWWE
jgi:hypothetical protein